MPFGELADVDPFRLEAMRLDELRMLAMETQLEAELEMNHPELVIGTLEAAVQESPYREHLWLMLIEALTRNGRRREALQACHELRSLLGEIGLEPGTSLIALEDRIVQGTAALLRDGAIRQERLEPMGDQIGHAVPIFDETLDDHGRGLPRHLVVGLPDGRQDDDVDESGLVFEVEEAHPVRRAGSLSMGHHSPDPDALPRPL